MQKGTDVVLVTGAPGQQGGGVARQLLSRGHNVRALTRKPQGEAAKALAGLGAEVVPGDLDDVGSLEKALRGVWGVFSVQNTWEAGVEGEVRQGNPLGELALQPRARLSMLFLLRTAHMRVRIPPFSHNS